MPRHILNITDFTSQDIFAILSVANKIAVQPSLFEEAAKGKILATLFFEPSTRTRLSFESAMLRLGGSVIGFSDAASSSAAKGETPEDTARVVSCYCDIMAVRHPVPYTPHAMAKAAGVPLINAGDGANEHPTQTLTDLVTIHQKFGRLDHLTIGLCGDLLYGRTVHSLVQVLSEYPGNRFVLIAPPALALPQQYLTMLEQKGISCTISERLEEAIPQLDILYMTRIQKERFSDSAQYAALKGIYVLDQAKMQLAQQDMAVLHPLPRVDEISPEIDTDPRAWYFKQAQYGVYARMALIITLLGLADVMKGGDGPCNPFCSGISA